MSRVATRPEIVRSFTSMASPVEIRVVDPGPTAADAVDRAEAVVREIASSCTRFDERSELSRMNREPESFHPVSSRVAAVIDQAALAHRATGGLFDPRVLDTLLSWGYDRTFADVDSGDPGGYLASRGAPARPSDLPVDLLAEVDRAEDAHAVAGPPRSPRPAPPWAPVVLTARGAGSLVRPGGRLDLGGIAKGLAVRWAAQELGGSGSSWLVDAGGDLMLGGAGPDGTGWRVGVEDPFEGESPVLVLRLEGQACATSSTRRRRWRSHGAQVHHLVDPRTGRPGGAGLASVTVVHPDPAWAEIWSKTLFLAGERHVARESERRGLAAAWVAADARIGTSDAMEPLVMWRAR